MKTIFFYAIPILLVLQFSCTPVRVVSTQAQEEISYKDYHTFNFMDLDIMLKNDSLSDAEGKGIHMLKSTISKEMEALGYSEAENPDLWVNIGIVVEPKTQTRTTDIREAPVYIGQRRYHWESEEVLVAQYEEGTVSIDIVDAKKEERIWEGVVAGTITDNPKKLEKRIHKAMALLFKKFPE